MKKAIGILVVILLIISGIGTIVYAQDPWENDILKFETHNWYNHVPQGDIFINDTVNGYMSWAAIASNEQFASEGVVSDLTFNLENELDFSWNPILMGDPEITIESFTAGPSYFEWIFSDVGVGGGINMFLYPNDPNESPVTYEPGFDVVRWVDKAQFSQTDGTQVQNLTIVITPREDYTPITNNILIYVAADENFIIPTDDEYDLVEAVFSLFPNDIGFVMDNDHLLMIPLADWQTGKPITIQTEITVTPLAPSIEYVPTVWVAEVVESEEYGDIIWGNAFDLIEQPFLGTWAVTTTTEHWLWYRTNIQLKGVNFPNVHPGIETFNVGSMFINFNDGISQDEISITEANFSLALGTAYDLNTDDITVIVDGVTITIPASSFNKIGGLASEKYIYNSKGTEQERLQMVIDFDEGVWSLIGRNMDAGLVDNNDGVAIVFAIGENAAIEVINMKIGGLSYSATG